MTNRYPYGYAKDANGVMGMGTMLTWDQMMTKKTVYNLHPEVRRRFKALIEKAASEGVPLGVGTGWRVQPNPPPPGFAKPGNSWHESCPVSPASPSAFAIDTVPNISWDWLGRNCATYGLRVFTHVNNEPWHAQPVDIPTGRKYATTPPPIGIWNLPGKPSIPSKPPLEDDVHPTVCSWGEGRLDIFQTGKDSQLWHKWWDASYSDQWSEWEALGGILIGPPTATAWAVGRIDIFGLGQDGSIWQIAWDSDTGGWSSWYSLGASA